MTAAWFSPFLRLAKGASGRIVAWRTRCAERLALQTLLDAPAHRLADLGINPHDVREALEARRR